MDGFRFDHFTRRMTESRLSRRATLKSGGLGVAASAFASLGFLRENRGVAGKSAKAYAMPSAQDGTPTAENPDAMNIDGAWFCKQTFGLCTTAPCELAKDNPTIANCQCIVQDSYSIGYKSCEERAPSGNNLHSNFSTVNVNSAFYTMTCPENAPWANCLDMPCEINTYNPALAVCQCEMIETGPSLTFGGGCDTSTCTSTIWSAAPEGLLGLSQYETGMKRVNQEVDLPTACPSATPVASPADATPRA